MIYKRARAPQSTNIGAGVKKPRTDGENTATSVDASTRLKEECVQRIEQARVPHDILRAMEDLTPSVLREWPELLALLASRVLPVCQDNPVVLGRAIDFCLGAGQQAATRHPLGEGAEAIILSWVQQAEALPPPSASAVWHRVEQHLRQIEPACPTARAACANRLVRLRRLVDETPGEVLLLMGHHLDPDRDPLRREVNPVALARQRHRAYLSCASVNKAFHQSLTPLLREAWVGWVCAHINHDAGRYQAGAQQDLNDCLNAAKVERQLSIRGAQMWPEVFHRVHSPLSGSEAQKALLIALFMDRDPQRVLEALAPLLDRVVRSLRDERTGQEEHEDLVRWSADLLALAYQKWVAPDHAAFGQLVDLVLQATLQLAPPERFDLLFELAVLSMEDGPRARAVTAAIDELRATVRADWGLLDDGLLLVRGEGGAVPAKRVRAVLKHLLKATTERGAVFARVLSAVARLPEPERYQNLLVQGLHDLMRDAAHLEEGESPPRLRQLVFDLFEPQCLLEALDLETMDDTVLLSYLVQPPTWGGLALLKALVSRTDTSPTAAMQALVRAMAASAEDQGLKGALLALLDTIRPAATDELSA